MVIIEKQNMRKIFYGFLFLIISFPTFSQISQESDSTLVIWTVFTIGDFINDNAYRITTEKWPFKYNSVAGDVITEQLNKDVEEHNEKLWETLSKKGYINPEKEYYEQFASERKRIELASDLVTNDSLFIQLKKKLRTEGYMDYTKLIKISDTSYLFEIASFNPNDLTVEEKLELKLRVDLKEKKVIRQ